MHSGKNNKKQLLLMRSHCLVISHLYEEASWFTTNVFKAAVF